MTGIVIHVRNSAALSQREDGDCNKFWPQRRGREGTLLAISGIHAQRGDGATDNAEMARWPRLWRPGNGVHFISRFVDRKFCLLDDEDRDAYLTHIRLAHTRWDWRWLSYALMSSHVHHGILAGIQPPDRFFRSVHTRMAIRYHRRYGTLGPVLADRPKSYDVPIERLARMVAYHHRNPVEAGVVKYAKDSTWTSHRAYLRLDPAPVWLDVAWALSVLGFDDTSAGRRHFDQFVQETDLKRCGAGGEEPSPSERTAVNVVQGRGMPPPGSEVQWQLLISSAAEVMGVSPVALVRSRSHDAARRIVVWIAHDDFGQSYPQIAHRLGRAASSVHSLITRPSKESLSRFEIQRARVLARLCADR